MMQLSGGIYNVKLHALHGRSMPNDGDDDYSELRVCLFIRFRPVGWKQQ